MKTTPAQANRAKKMQKNLVSEIKFLNESIKDIEDTLYSRLPDLPEYPSLFQWYANTIQSQAKQDKFYESKGGFLKWVCSSAMEENAAELKKFEEDLRNKTLN